jgi:hypothetical protein
VVRNVTYTRCLGEHALAAHLPLEMSGWCLILISFLRSLCARTALAEVKLKLVYIEYSESCDAYEVVQKLSFDGAFLSSAVSLLKQDDGPRKKSLGWTIKLHTCLWA